MFETDDCGSVGRSSFSWANQLVRCCIIARFLYFSHSYQSPDNGAYLRWYRIAEELNKLLVNVRVDRPSYSLEILPVSFYYRSVKNTKRIE